MAVGGAENTGLAILVCPSDRLFLATTLTLGRGKRLGFRPHLLNHVQLIHRCHPIVRHALQDRMLQSNLLYRVTTLMLVTATGHTKKLAPVIGFGRAIGVHRAVNHHRG
ncbi:uncharacterized protein METZ01_LOCUS167229, partial [marine metagenome]